jgi:hypothetical protein
MDDGSSEGGRGNSYTQILLLSPQASVKEALLLIKVHREGISTALDG